MSHFEKISVKDGRLNISGALFANTDRQSENHPNAKSWDKDNGIGMAAWTKQSQTGMRYQSVSIDIEISKIPANVIQALTGGAAPAQSAPSTPQGGLSDADLDEDLPF